MKLIQTMVFFDDINVALEASKWIRSWLPPHLQDQVAVYNSRRSKRAKDHVLQEYRKGQIKILLTTEAAGMGCDLPRVKQVVQFMVPKSMSIWTQRAGRGGCNHHIHARAILLVQPSVFQELKPVKGIEPEDGEVKYRKDVEAGLREWIETDGCRRDTSAIYFNDGVPQKLPTGICCDNCLLKSNTDHPLLARSNTAPHRPISPVVIPRTHLSKRQMRMVNGKWLKEPRLPTVETLTSKVHESCWRSGR